MKPGGYGNRLVCVRYRYDSDRQRRIKTVELIEEEQPWLASGAVYLVKDRLGRSRAPGENEDGWRPPASGS